MPTPARPRRQGRPPRPAADTAPPRPAGAATTVGAETGAGNGSSHAGPPSRPDADPVVEASSGSLAFTGVGVVAQWLAVVGGALMVLGFVLLVMVDTPRRLMYRLAHTGPDRRTAASRTPEASARWRLAPLVDHGAHAHADAPTP